MFRPDMRTNKRYAKDHALKIDLTGAGRPKKADLRSDCTALLRRNASNWRQPRTTQVCMSFVERSKQAPLESVGFFLLLSCWLQHHLRQLLPYLAEAKLSFFSSGCEANPLVTVGV